MAHRSLFRIPTLLLLILATAATSVAAQDVHDLWVGDGPVHFSLQSNQIVPDSLVTDSNWDILIDGTEIKPNGTGILVAAAFDAVTAAPAEGLKDGAVRTVDGGRWYNYDQDNHFVWPQPDHTIVVVLKDGTQAKVEIYSYYNLETEEPRYLSFRFEML